MRARHTLALSSGILALGLTLTGCTGAAPDTGTATGTTSETAAAEFNSTDTMFVTMMIPHHQQAVEMSDVLLAKEGVDPAVQELAQQIRDAQAPEIGTMLGWLEEWGIPYDESAAGGMDHGDGMMTADDMAELDEAAGPEAGRLFLEQMILHHEGALEMAEAAENGKHPDVVALAAKMAAAQAEEITTMQKMLKTV